MKKPSISHIVRLFIFLVASVSVYARQLPVSVRNYELRNLSDAGMSFYSIREKDGVVYCGNENGLLRFNGNNWNLSKPGKSSSVVSMLFSGNKIYGAGAGNFGYWKIDDCGALNYTSLDELFDGTLLKGEYIKQIIGKEGQIYIESFRGLYEYDGEKVVLVDEGDSNRHIYKCGDDLVYFSDKDKAIHRIEGTSTTILTTTSVDDTTPVVLIQKIEDGRFLITFRDGKIFSADSAGQTHLMTDLHRDYPGIIISCCDGIENLIAFGTRNDGIIAIDTMTGDAKHITSPDIIDNVIKSLSFAEDNTLWVTSGSGVSRIQFHPSLYSWKKDSEIGTFYDAVSHNGKIYVCTNNGIFLFDGGDAICVLNRNDMYSLGEVKQKLYAGAASGLYAMDDKDGKFRRVSNITDIGQFEYLPTNNGEYLFTQTVFGFEVLKYEESDWEHINSFNLSKFGRMVTESPRIVWLLQADLGLWRYYLSDDLKTIVSTDHFEDIDGCNDFKSTHVIKVDDGILFFTSEGVYMYDAVQKKFNKNDALSNTLPVKSSYAIETTGNNTVWTAGNDGLFKYKIDNLSASRTLKKDLSGMWLLHDTNYEYPIRSIGDSLTFFRTMSATAILNENQARDEAFDGELKIDRILYKNRKGETFYYPLGKDKIRLPSWTSYMEISIATGADSYSNMISYRLGRKDSFKSPWQTDGKIVIPNVLPGNYTLVVNNAYMKTVEVHFRIPYPLFERPWMYSIYMLLTLLAIYLIYRLSHKYHKMLIRKKEEEEKRKNIEIAERTAQQKNKDKVLSLEYYYVEVHHDFIVRLKQKYPDLTTSDLKLACYIRAGLSSKEISQLLSIETNSVDVKKTRLKKRLNLDKSKQLSDFLISF